MMSREAGNVRVRIAPSPTGHFHVGTARTALFNWLFAQQHKGKFIVRIEDTDATRSEGQFEGEILEALDWLGLSFDEGPGKEGAYGPYRQSERAAVYRAHLERMIQEGTAYYCYCTKEELEAQRQSLITQGLPPKYAGTCRDFDAPPPGKASQVIRFKTPGVLVEFRDLIRGKVEFDANLFGDMVIAKNLDAPLYNFAVVVDDEAMQISHVIRGEDHLANTPKQILMQRALGFQEPIFAHLPLILAPDRSKLSKRSLETSLFEYRTRGFLPDAMVNFLALLGWHPKDGQEIFGREALVRRFDIRHVQKSGAVFDEEKLSWFNAQYIKQLSDEALMELLRPLAPSENFFSDSAFALKVIRVERERIASLSEFFELASFFFSLPEYENSLLLWQKETPEVTRHTLIAAQTILNELPENSFSDAPLKESLKELIAEKGTGNVLWPLRVALSGRAASPDPFDIMRILGKEEILKRVHIAIEKLPPSLV